MLKLNSNSSLHMILSIYNIACFKCCICHRVLDSRIACDGPDNDIYCTGCYRKKYGIKGYGFGQGGPALMSGDLAERYFWIKKTNVKQRDPE